MGPGNEEDPMSATEVSLSAYDVAMENFDTAAEAVQIRGIYP